MHSGLTVGLQRWLTGCLLQAVFNRRKTLLFKKALELSMLCDSEIGLVIFNSSGQLCQYASRDMEKLLERYSKACSEPHERRTNDEVSLERPRQDTPAWLP